MADLFTAQPYAFPSFDAFTPQLTDAQESMLEGQPVDDEFQQQTIINPSKGPEQRVLRFFGRNNQRFVRFTRGNGAGVSITSNALGTYENQRQADQAAKNAAAALIANSGYAGEKSAKNTVAIAKAAFSIIGRASQAQLDQAGVHEPRNPGILKFGFPLVQQLPQAEQLLKEMGRFIDPVTLRQAMLTFNMADNSGAFRSEAVSSMIQDDMQPGNNLAEEAAMISDHAVRFRHIREGVIQRMRFQRLLPHYTQLGSSAAKIITRTANQHRALNGFKARSNDRFMIV